MAGFKYYRRMREELALDGCPRIPERDALLDALIREHGPAGRPDVAREIEQARRMACAHH